MKLSSSLSDKALIWFIIVIRALLCDLSAPNFLIRLKCFTDISFSGLISPGRMSHNKPMKKLLGIPIDWHIYSSSGILFIRLLPSTPRVPWPVMMAESAFTLFREA